MNEAHPLFPRLTRAVETAARDARLARLGRHCTTAFMVSSDGAAVYLGVERGRVVDIVPGPRHLRSYRFRIDAGWTSWERFWSVLPPPGFHDLFAMARFGHARIDGDLGPLLEHLAFVKRFLALPRAAVDDVRGG